MKQFLFILFAASMVTLLFTPANSLAGAKSEPATLNSHVMVNGEVVLLGDIFTNAGKKSGQAIAYAPNAGQKAVFDAPWLGRVAKAFNINWAPTSGLERAIVERNSEVIETDEIKSLLTQRLIEEGIDPSSEIILSNKSMRLYAPAGLSNELEIKEMSFDRVSGRFSAKLLWQGENKSQQVRVSGRV
ncbi:MAG: hypothetical protein KAQ66_10090, partial [Rhodospirillaceae bacterium]|nr:hypothetical protein [Rhodospirillaceae bacterium]